MKYFYVALSNIQEVEIEDWQEPYINNLVDVFDANYCTSYCTTKELAMKIQQEIREYQVSVYQNAILKLQSEIEFFIDEITYIENLL